MPRGICFIYILCTLLVACNQADNSRSNGKEVRLPSNALRVLQARELKQPEPVFRKFDGRYPEDWPDGIKLPEDFHSSSEPVFKQKQSKDIGTILNFSGISHNTPDDLYASFKKQLIQEGWVFTIEKVMRPSTMNKFGGRRFQAELGTGAGKRLFLVSIFIDPNADGWTYFAGGYSYP